MFAFCYWLDYLDLTTFNTSSVSSMDYMFYNCFIPKRYPDDFIQAVEMFYDVSNVVVYEGFMDKKLLETIKEQYTKVTNNTLESCEEQNKITLKNLLREEYLKIGEASRKKHDEGDNPPHLHTESFPSITGPSVEEELEEMINSIPVPIPVL